MHAHIITGGTPEKRSEHINTLLSDWKIATHDQHIVEPDGASITVADIRALKKTLILRPRASSYNVAVLRESETLTPAAQNALLKLLEEPPPHARIILDTASVHTLLPTVVSRCHVVHVSTDHQTDNVDAQLIEQLTSVTTVSNALALSDTIGTSRNDVSAFVTRAIATLRAQMVSMEATNTPEEHKQLARMLRAFVDANTRLAANVTPRAVLDQALLVSQT